MHGSMNINVEPFAVIFVQSPKF